MFQFRFDEMVARTDLVSTMTGDVVNSCSLCGYTAHMAKSRIVYLCRSCGGVQSRWLGKCPDCGQWDSLEKMREPSSASADRHDSIAHLAQAGDGNADEAGRQNQARPLPEIDALQTPRFTTQIGEFDRVLGGGLVPGSVTLLGGDPGIGKSTILLQVSAAMSLAGRRVLYVSSEESAYQTRLRAERILQYVGGGRPHGGVPAGESGTEQPDGPVHDRLMDLFVLADTNLARIIEQARQINPEVIVVDSVQMVYRPDIEASPGSVTQLRRCCMDLVNLAKRTGTAVILVGHVTKEGRLAGPKLLEHLVDTVLSFEGDVHQMHRIVRGIKNRFGATSEVGLFEMTGQGLAEVVDGGMIADSQSPRPGSVICPSILGTRCLLVEIQALTATGLLGNAKRKTSGIDSARLAMLIAVLEQHGGLRLADQDTFVSAVGGLKVAEPAADLAISLAIAGVFLKRAVAPATIVLGELGLGGEIRPVRQMELRLREAGRLGYRHAIVCVPRGGGMRLEGILPGSLVGCRHISDAIEHLSPVQPLMQVVR